MNKRGDERGKCSAVIATVGGRHRCGWPAGHECPHRCGWPAHGEHLCEYEWEWVAHADE